MSADVWIAVALAALCGAVAGAASSSRRRGASGDDVRTALDVQAAELRRLADTAAQRELTAERLRQGLDGARRALEELRIRDQERRATDGEHREVVRRLATVLAGGASKGRSGEHVLRQHLADLPPGMLTSDVRVNGKVVEFGLVLPDGRRLPIDSKWTAVAELEALEAADDPVRRDECARAVERAVVARTKEVAQYLDPSVTAPIAVAAVPDAVYGVLKRAHADAFAHGVVVVPYGSALPIVLFLYELVRRYGDGPDARASLAEIARALDVMDAIVENRFAKAATMLTNGADEFRTHLGKARGSIARAQAADADPPLTVVQGGQALPARRPIPRP
ncbi:MAG: DNA recombination protein RmuC [Actinomycetota bacterium]